MRTFNRKYAAIALLSLVGIGTTTLFQNCSKSAFSQNGDSLASNANGLSELTTFAQTTLNTPVTFNLKLDRVLSGVTISYKMNTPNGSFTTVDGNRGTVQFNPAFGFRGRQEAVAVLTDRYGSSSQLSVVVDVGNTFTALEPALAVRGMGCIQCHANVASNIITDFGYQGDGQGRDYFFNKGLTNSWNSGALYGDHESNFNTMTLTAGKTAYVPKASLPANVISDLSKNIGAQSVADYVKWQFGISANAGTKAANVVEANQIYIGAPTATQIASSLKLGPNDRLKFYRNDVTSPTLSGFVDKGSYVKASGAVVCDGDVAIRGPLLLENLVIDTNEGCRMYVIGTVFVSGGITFANANPNRNVQIQSSRAIAMGLGQSARGGAVCGDAAEQGFTASQWQGPDSLVGRLQKMWTAPTQVTRESGNAQALAANIVGDENTIIAGEGNLYDAVCLPGGRDVSFERILLNAPQVLSRYRGNFDGTVIAEVAIMSLNQFRFQFDDVFNEVPVLPFIDKSLYLEVRN